MNWDWDKLREKQEQFEKNQGGFRGGIPKPPQMDEMLNKFKQFKFPGGIAIVAVLVLIIIGSSMVFTIGVDEVGVIQRFGKYERLCQPGLNFKLPAGIETLTKVKVKRVYNEAFGFKTINGGNNQRFTSANEDLEVALMLTGDLNVAVVPWIVQYRISNPYDYLFKVKGVRTFLRDMAEATMRTVIGDRSINEVISKRDEIAIAAKASLQKEMTKNQTGIHIVTLQMKKTDVPGPVQASFNEVNEAVQEKQQMIYKAKEEYNRAVPAARGEAKRVVKDAQGYALDRVNRAQGDAARFTSVYKEYIKAKDVTRRRLYIEAMAKILPRLGRKYIIDSDQKNMLPLLSMGGGASVSPLAKKLFNGNGVKK